MFNSIFLVFDICVFIDGTSLKQLIDATEQNDILSARPEGVVDGHLYRVSGSAAFLAKCLRKRVCAIGDPG